MSAGIIKTRVGKLRARLATDPILRETAQMFADADWQMEGEDVRAEFGPRYCILERDAAIFGRTDSPEKLRLPL